MNQLTHSNGSSQFKRQLCTKTTLFIIKMKHFSIDHNSSSVHSWQIVVFESSPRRPITLRILTEMRLYMESLRKSDYTRNHDYVDGMAIMFWLIRRQEIVVLIMLTCSIWCLTMRKRFYTEFHFYMNQQTPSNWSLQSKQQLCSKTTRLFSSSKWSTFQSIIIHLLLTVDR